MEIQPLAPRACDRASACQALVEAEGLRDALILHPHLRRSLDWSQPLMSEGDKGAVLALSAMIRQGMPSYSSVGDGWEI